MVDIAALLKKLPVSKLEPNRVASIGGFVEVPKDQDWRVRIMLLEPPAGQRVPYIEPVEALEILLRAQGVAPKDAKARALEAVDFHVERTQLMNPETSLEERGAPARVVNRLARRAAFTRQLKEIRLDDDYCGSGLSDERGRMLGYDLLNLPFPLVRRIAAWQCDFDDAVMPPDEEGSDAWRDRHAEEAVEIAKAPQAALGENTVVKPRRKQGWISVDEVIRVDGGVS